MLHNPVVLALLGTGFTFLATAVGAAFVFFVRRDASPNLQKGFMGFAAGVMIAASYWSLLAPALEGSAHLGRWAFLPVAGGFLAGAGVLRLIDLVMPHLHPMTNEQDGPSSTLPRATLLILAITLHNIPEGLAVGVSMGAAQASDSVSMADALTLMLGIGLQNLPEGLAVSVPLLREGYSKGKAFFIGQLSGMVEPVGVAQPLLPFSLAFAAGAMIFVVVEEVIPEAHASGHGDAATAGAILGFTLMMCLDVALA